MKISIIIPCHNEEKTIGTVLTNLKALELDTQIIVVNDGSTDNTAKVLEEHEELIDNLIVLSENQGKGAGIRTALDHVTGDIIVIQDADLEYDVNCIPSLVAPIINDAADVVYGSRFLSVDKKGHPINYITNKFFSWVYAKKTGWKLTDVNTCQKAFRSQLLSDFSIEEGRFGFELEVTAKLSKFTSRFKEIPITYKPRTKKEGKHIGFMDGLRDLYLLFIY